MASTSSSSIPRLLLRRGTGLAPRVRIVGGGDALLVRFGSGTARDAKGKPIVLEKPARFNPPSHGSRLPRKNRPQQQHYGGDLSADEKAAQKTREYPGLPPSQGSWAHWFLRSRWLHLCITTGTLFSLALYTYVENFKANSPFAEMLPSTADYLQHPIISIRTTHEVWQLTTLHNSAIVAEKRKKRVDDVAKRSEYRKAHGLEQEGGLGNWTAKEDPQAPQPGKREKWLGIF